MTDIDSSPIKVKDNTVTDIDEGRWWGCVTHI